MAFAAATLLQLVLLIAWTCLNDTPSKRKHTVFAQFFTSQAVFGAIASAVSISFCPGLFDVLRDTTPPTLEFFKNLPMPTDPELKAIWGVYVVVMEKVGCRPRIYVGSSTHAEQGMRARLQQYGLGLNIPQYIQEALEEGYSVTHKGLLCWIPRPMAVFVPIRRLLIIVLEATFAYIFWAIRTPRGGDYGMAHICLWDRKALEYDGLCSHCCLNEGIHGDFDLTDEQLEAQAADKEEKRVEMKAENATNWHYKQMETNYDEYMTAANARVYKSRATNPRQRMQTERTRIQKALNNKEFHCGLCKISFGTKLSLENHKVSPKHARKSKQKDNPFVCRTCDLGFVNKQNFNRHNKTQTHLTAVAAASSSSKLD